MYLLYTKQRWKSRMQIGYFSLYANPSVAFTIHQRQETIKRDYHSFHTRKNCSRFPLSVRLFYERVTFEKYPATRRTTLLHENHYAAKLIIVFNTFNPSRFKYCRM